MGGCLDLPVYRGMNVHSGMQQENKEHGDGYSWDMGLSSDITRGIPEGDEWWCCAFVWNR